MTYLRLLACYDGHVFYGALPPKPFERVHCHACWKRLA